MSQVQKVVLVPRFSAFAGEQEFRSSPVNVRDFSKAELTAWRSAYYGTGTSMVIWLEESFDLNVWTQVAGGTLSPGAGAEATAAYDLELPWIRTVVAVAGTTPAVTCWLVGNFTLRDR